MIGPLLRIFYSLSILFKARHEIDKNIIDKEKEKRFNLNGKKTKTKNDDKGKERRFTIKSTNYILF